MSASFRYEVINPAKAKSFAHGTSSDVDAPNDIFGKIISTKYVPVLRAMHKATHLSESLWNDIADLLEHLQGNDYDKEVSIKVWVEY